MPMGQPVEITQTEPIVTEFRAAAWIRDEHAARRVLAAALVLEGKRRRRVGESYSRDQQALWDWTIHYNEGGQERLADRVPPGPAPRLTPKQMAEVADIVDWGSGPAVDHVVLQLGVGLSRILAER